MSKYHEVMKRKDESKPKRVAEPVQVYLDRGEVGQLNRLAAMLGATRSDVIRRGLGALERQLTDPAEHPLLKIMSIDAAELSPAPYDVAREHDRFLAETEVASWGTAKRKRAR